MANRRLSLQWSERTQSCLTVTCTQKQRSGDRHLLPRLMFWVQYLGPTWRKKRPLSLHCPLIFTYMSCRVPRTQQISVRKQLLKVSSSYFLPVRAHFLQLHTQEVWPLCLLFKSLYFYFMFMTVLSACICVSCVYLVHLRPEKGVRSPKLEAHMVLSCHVCDGTWTRVLCKSSKCSLWLIHLPSPQHPGG